MTRHVRAELTVREAAILAGVPKRRIEKDCEEGIIPERASQLWMRGTNAAHVPLHAVAHAQAMQSFEGIKMERKAKRLVWKRLRDKACVPFGTVELSPGLSLDLDSLVSDAWRRTRSYLDARGRYLDIDPEIFGGEPIIKGARNNCQSALGRLDGGETLSELLEDYPNVTKEAFEAAQIDGASRWQRVRCVVVPYMAPLVFFITLVQLMDNFRVLEPIVGFSASAKATSHSWIIMNDLRGEDIKLFGSAAATSLLTIIGVVILLTPVLIRTWRGFGRKAA